MNLKNGKLGLATKIILCGIMISVSLWYKSYINNQHYQFAGYANFGKLMLTGHVPMLALVPEALRDAYGFYSECSRDDWSDIPQVILDLFMAYLNLAMWALGTFGIFAIHEKWVMWIAVFYIATIVVNVGNVVVFGIGTI